MRLEFTYTAQDFDELWRIKWPEEATRRRRSAWSGAISVALLLAGLASVIFFRVLAPRSSPWMSAAAFDWHNDSIVPIVFAIGASIALAVFYLIRRHRKLGAAYLRSHPMSQQPQTMVIGDDYIDASTPLGSAQYRWVSFTNWAETQNLFTLRLTGKHGILVLPKRAANDEQQKELRELFKIQIINPTGGFPVTPPSASQANG